MINIGICDDESKTCQDLAGLLKTWSIEHQVPIQVSIWLTGNELCGALNQRTVLDLLFLDIEMSQCSGYDAGYFIRDILCDLTIRIVFISHAAQHAPQLFEYQPLQFLIKPITVLQLDRVFQLYYRSIGSQEPCFILHKNNQICQYLYRDIVLFSSMNRKIKIVLKESEDDFYGKLKDVRQNLPGYFLQIHQSFIVNVNFIHSFTYEYVLLYKQQRLSISKPYRKLVREKLLKWGTIRNGGSL
jgi:DNA-binding LytR/AlgR family response regulator